MKLLTEQRIKKSIAVILMLAAVFCYAAGAGRSEKQELPGTEITALTGDTETAVSEAPAADELTVPAVPESEAAQEEEILVHVCGAVEAPGVYALSEGSRIGDAVEAAGGFSETAAADALNLAQPLTDGLQIRIPTMEEYESVKGAGSGSYSAAWIQSADGTEVSGRSSGTEQKINLNTATKQQLMNLTGIGEARAEAILSYRRQAGAFSSVEEIMKVPGIKEAAFEKIKDDITV